MRICMVVYSFYESDNRVMRYAESLVKRGNDVTVIALRKDDQLYKETYKGVNLYRIQKRVKNEKRLTTFMARLMKFLLKSSIVLIRLQIKKPFQLIHVHNVPDFLVFSAFLTKLRGAKIILDCHDIVPEFYASKFRENNKSLLFKALVLVEKASAAFADHVIASNHLWGKTLVSRSVKEGKCTVIMNYPDQSVFYRRPRTRNDNKFIMLYPGTFNWHQGLDIAVKAFNLIKEKAPEAELHMYGSGNTQTALQALINELGLQGRVFLEDSLPIEEVVKIMANADLGIVPKRNDPFGGTAFSTKILEFMSLGIPVIVSDTKIDTYYFNDSLVKFFKAGDEDDLAQSMLAMIHDKGLRDSLSQNALKFIEDYTWETKKTMYLDLVDSLVRKK